MKLLLNKLLLCCINKEISYWKAKVGYKVKKKIITSFIFLTKMFKFILFITILYTQVDISPK